MSILNNQLAQSKLGLKGSTPETREHARTDSELHVLGTANKRVEPNHSNLDLDGLTPTNQYLNNLPK